MKRWKWVVVLAVGMVFIGCNDGTTNRSAQLPDPPFVNTHEEPDGAISGVVLIVIDTLRADHLGCYGSIRGLTPNIDEFAAQSHLFENAVASSSWTRPSIAGIFTSRYPTSLGLLDKDDRLSESAVTVAEVLQQQLGFQTLAVNTNGNTSKDMGFSQGFDQFVRPFVRRRYPGDFPIYVAEGVTQRNLELLDYRDPHRPFFLFSLYVDPHDPYLPHPGYLSEVEPSGRFDGSRRQLRELDRLEGRARPEDYERIRHLYAGEVAYVDHWVGEFLEGFQDRGLNEHVMVILTADHGEGLWAHKRRGHGYDLYEEMVHVPLLIHLPDMTSRDATRISQAVSLVDLAPTMLAAVGAKQPLAFQGSDLGPLLRAEKRGPAFDYIYSEMDHRGQNFESIRKESWKLIKNRNADETMGDDDLLEVFDLSADPQERVNLAEKLVLNERVQLEEALHIWSLAVLGEAVGGDQITSVEISRETMESLVALGYVDIGKPAGEHESLGDAQRPPIPSLDLPEVEMSQLDFVNDEAAASQIIGGRSGADAGPLDLGPESEITVLLRRSPAHDRWVMEGILEVDDVSSFPVSLVVNANNSGIAKIDVYEAGPLVLEGPLPPATGATLVFTIHCGFSSHISNQDPPDTQRRSFLRVEKIEIH